MGQTASTSNTGTPNNRVGGSGGSANIDSQVNDRRRVTFGGPAAAMHVQPKSPRQPNPAGMSSRRSWPNLQLPPDLAALANPETPGPSTGSSNYLFHLTHGKNIAVSSDRKLATRSGSFCNAIVFTHRPVRLKDPLHLQLIQSTQGWSGVIRFGFTCHSPDRLKSHMLPKYACPDLTVKPGYWVKALRENLAANGNVLSFFVNSRGEVFYSINADPYHMFFNGVDVSKPLWALVDVYGNTTGVKILDEHSSHISFNLPPAINYHHGDNIGRGPSSSASSHSLPPSTNTSSPSPPTEGSAQPAPASLPHLPPLPALPPPTTAHPLLEPLPFHNVHGSNIMFSDGLMVAERKNDVFAGGIVFVCRSLKIDEAVFICVKKVNHRYIGHLGIGLTTCDPKTLRETPIPDDSDLLYDRPEYWVLTREFEAPSVNDCLGVVFNSEGEVHLLNTDGTSKSCLMFVDTTMPLWLFFDVYGTTQAIHTLGFRSISIPSTGMTETTADSNSTNLASSEAAAASLPVAEAAESLSSYTPAVSLPTPVPISSSSASASASSSPANTATVQVAVAAATSQVSSSSSKPKPPRPSKPPTRPVSKVPQAQPPSQVEEDEESECTICFEAPVNAVFYKCGHVCCCFSCANKIRGSTCPICRAVIADVIKMYKP